MAHHKNSNHMGIYQLFKDYLGAYQHQDFISKMKTEAAKPGTATIPGAVIMGRKPANIEEVFTYFVEYIQANAFEWSGSGPAAGYNLLDGNSKIFQCEGFVNGFKLLCTSPPPYGLGLPDSDFRVETYKGPNREGFISKHPAGGILRLMPNTGTGLYLWENHKVLKHASSIGYYDPSYAKKYTSLEDMWEYGIEDDTNNRVIATTKGGATKYFSGSHPRWNGPFDSFAGVM